jgi:hypothetical protein
MQRISQFAHGACGNQLLTYVKVQFDQDSALQRGLDLGPGGQSQSRRLRFEFIGGKGRMTRGCVRSARSCGSLKAASREASGISLI